MSKEELIEKLEYWRLQMLGLKDFLESLRTETLMVKVFTLSVIVFLITACDYLETNLVEIRNRVQMS